MQLIRTTQFIFITLECYSTIEDIQETFEFTVQASDFDIVTDERILYEIEQISFGYDFDEMTIKIVERDTNGNFVEREIPYYDL